MSICKLLKWLVPRAGVEPARPCGQRILSLVKVWANLILRDEPVFYALATEDCTLRQPAEKEIVRIELRVRSSEVLECA